jgi:cytochrome b
MSRWPDKNASFESGRGTRPDMVAVWDAFVRVFHWSVVGFFAVAWYSGGIWEDAHLIAGYLVLALVVARIVWGFIGPLHAKFSDFICGPRTLLRYGAAMLRLRAPRFLGHNPLGGAMVLALLATLLVICISGVLMTTDAYWGVAWVDTLHASASTLAVILVVLHSVGVLVTSLAHHENLVWAMITGRKRAGPGG